MAGGSHSSSAAAPAPPPATLRLQRSVSSTSSGRPCDDPELWLAALDGVTHFANAIVAPVSMPGFVPGETAAALVLRALADSQDATNNPHGELILRPPVRAWTSLTSVVAAAAAPDDPMTGAKPATARPAASDAADAVAAVGAGGFLPSDPSAASFDAAGAADGSSGGGPRARLREFIRGLNFQLLQLARPENLLVSPLALPKEYRAEYVLRQVRLTMGVRGLMRSFGGRHILSANPIAGALLGRQPHALTDGRALAVAPLCAGALARRARDVQGAPCGPVLASTHNTHMCRHRRYAGRHLQPHWR